MKKRLFSKDFRKLYLIFLFVFLISLTVSMFSHYHTINTIRRQLYDQANTAVQNIQTRLDTTIGILQTLALNYARDDTVQSLLVRNSAPRGESLIRAASLADKIRTDKAENHNISDIFIYFANSGSVISSTRHYSQQSEYIYNSIGFQSETALASAVSGYHMGETKLFKTGITGKDYRLQVYNPMLYSGTYRHGGVIVIDASLAALFSAATPDRFYERELFIYSPESGVYYSPEYFGTVEAEQLEVGLGDFFSELLGQQVITIKLASKVCGLQYIAAVPVSELYQEVYSILIFITVILAVCVALYLFIAYFATLRIYYPFERILNMVSGKSGEGFDVVEQAIKTMLEHKKAYRVYEHEHDTRVKTEFISNLLSSGKCTNSTHSEQFAHFLSAAHYVVILFTFPDYSQIFFDTYEIEDSEKCELAYVIVNSVVEESLSEYGEAKMSHIDERATCILSCADLPNITLITESINTAIGFIGVNFGLTLYASVSSPVQSVRFLPFAYRDAVNTLEYAKLTDVDELCVTDEILDGFNGPLGSGFLKKERYLTTLFLEKRIEELPGVLSEIIRTELSDLGIQELKQRIAVLRGIIYEGFLLFNTDEYSEYFNSLKPFQRLEDVKGIEALSAEVKELTDAYLSFEEESKFPRQPQLGTLIEGYIAENYSNINLDINSISNAFSISPPYVSRVFKKLTGMTVLEYIHKLRIDSAKALLSSTRKNIREIAAEVGYSDPRTLTRTFRRTEGISPLDYRHINQ